MATLFHSRRPLRFHQKVLTVLTLAVGCLLGLPSCMTRANTKKLQQTTDPKSEFRDLRSDCHGIVWREGPNFVLLVTDLFSSGHVLRLDFPPRPFPSRRYQQSIPQILRRNQSPVSSSNSQPVHLTTLEGVFDTTSEVLAREMAFTHGLPTRMVLGIDLRKHSDGTDIVTYTLGYQTAPATRYITAACAAELPWMKRSRAAIAGRSALYLLTVPLDAPAFPVENAAAVLMAPRR